MPDAHKNFAVSNIVSGSGGSGPASWTTVVLTTGHGARFPAAQFNAVICAAGQLPTPLNAEVVRVSAISTDTLTIARAQEGSSARTVVVGDQIFAAITAKTLTDVEGVVTAARAYRNAALTIGIGWTKVLLDTQSHDPGGNFQGSLALLDANALKGRYTVPATGYYQIAAAVSVNASAANQQLGIGVSKNAGGALPPTAIASYGTTASSTAAQTLEVVLSDIIACTAADYLELFGYCSAALALNAAPYNYFSVAQVG